MKRTLIALPLAAILLGLTLYVARKSAGLSGPLAPPAESARPPLEPPPRLAAKSDPKGPAATPSAAAPTGALQFLVSLRGKPVPDAAITVQKVGTDEFMRFKTEADGTQILHGLAPAEYGITVQQEDAILFYAAVPVPPGETIPVKVDLRTGGRVTGTVTDRSGRPIAGSRVFLLDEATDTPAAGEGTRTDDQGKYALKGIVPGAFAVRFRHDDYKPLDRKGLFIRSGGDEYTLDAVLEVGARLSGRVLDDSGAPIEGATLIAGNVDSAGLTKSAADGTFTVTGLTDAPANLSATKAGYGKVVQRNLPGNSTNVLFRLPKAGTILGRLVIDEVPRQTQINLSRYDEELKQVIPEESRFFALPTTATFAFGDVPPGTYWIDVLVAGYEAGERPQIVVAAGQTTNEVRITMRKKN